MTVKLFANRYDDVNYTGADAAESFEDIADLGIRWALPGGIQRCELLVKAKSKYDAYDRYQNHLGHRIAIYDSFCDRYIGGQVFEISLDGSYVLYICGGPWKRMNDKRYGITRRFTTTANTDLVIKDILTDQITIISSDQSNIDASSVSADGWVAGNTIDYVAEIQAGDAITELTLVGDSSDNIMDFYLVDQPFSGVQMRPPLAYLKSRSTTASPDWQFAQGDLVAGGLLLSRNIWNLVTELQINYNHLSGSATATATTLTDAGATFITDGVAPGDQAFNITRQTVYQIATVTSETVLTFTVVGAPNKFWNGDLYSVRLQRMASTAAASPTENYWEVEATQNFPELDQVSAVQLRDKLVNVYNDAVQQQSFVIGSPTIKDGNGASWPLHRPLMGNSFYFRVTDLFPEAALFSASDDRLQAFPVVAMDYTYRNSRLRVVPSTEDSRLDMLLAKAGLVSGQMINTETSSKRYVPPPPPPPAPDTDLSGEGGGFYPPGYPRTGEGGGFYPPGDPDKAGEGGGFVPP